MPARRSSARSGSCSTATSARSSRARSDGSATANHGFLRRIIITARDEDGRDFEAVGESVSRLIAPVPNTHVVSVNSLMDYRINGIQAWGDDQDSWALGTWAAMRRKQMGLGRRSPDACEHAETEV